MTPQAQARLVVVLGLAVLTFGVIAGIYALRDEDGSPDPIFGEIGLALSGGIIAALGVRNANKEQDAHGPDSGPDGGPEPLDALPEDE